VRLEIFVHDPGGVLAVAHGEDDHGCGAHDVATGERAREAGTLPDAEKLLGRVFKIKK
jgi:hypothetical protein